MIQWGLFFILGMSLLIPVNSQCRYRNRVFSEIQKTPNVVYGTAPQITPVYISEQTTTNINLHVDIFEPQNDTAQFRPVIIMAHVGGFIVGSKEAEDMQALCDTFAHHGYVTCAMQYRLYYNLISTTSSERAVYRAVQDVDALIRYLTEFADQYRIDTNRIFFLGSSAGAFAGLHHIFMQEQDRPASTFSGILQPDLGCKSCSGNPYQHQAKIRAMASCWGAIGDTTWIRQQNSHAPLLLFHGDADPIVPFGYGFPFTVNAAMPAVYGSSLIKQRMDNQQIPALFYPATGQVHEYWGTINGEFITAPSAYWPQMVSQINTFFADQLGFDPCLTGNEPNTDDSVIKLTYLNQQIQINYGEIFSASLYNMHGSLIFNTHGQSSANFSTDELPSGIYLVVIHTATSSMIKKVTITNL